jgi:4-carboxymuconolactone decarboxylase
MAKHDKLDAQTRDLVRFAAAVAQGYEPEVRERVSALKTTQVPVVWVEELLLQSILICGYPRALNAFATWRRIAGVPARPDDGSSNYDHVDEWATRGEATAGIIYGDNLEKLRDNVRGLHPAMDQWMIVEGYGRTLSRPGLDLLRRELCIVVQAAVLETPRQLHSHLRGSLNAGASFEQIEGVLSIANPLLSFDEWKRVKELWKTVREGWTGS